MYNVCSSLGAAGISRVVGVTTLPTLYPACASPKGPRHASALHPPPCQLHQVNEKLVDAADRYSDPARLHKTRSAIRQLKADVKAMNVLIGANWATRTGKQLSRQQAGELNRIGVQPSSNGGVGVPARHGGRSCCLYSPVDSPVDSPVGSPVLLLFAVE